MRYTGTAGPDTIGLARNGTFAAVFAPATALLNVNAEYITVLGFAGADTIADVFAGRTKCTMEERFDSGAWTELSTGSPALTDAVVAFDCRVIETKMVATHNVVFAGVVAVRLGRPGGALVYHARAYKQV